MKIIALITLFFATVAAMADDAFVPYFGDVPLMQGLTESLDDRILFDTPAGTIAETVLIGKVAAKNITAFYHDSLTALGWSKIDNNTNHAGTAYVRDNDLLILRIDAEGKLHLRLEPRT